MAEGFVFYRSYYESIQKIPDAEAKKLLAAICEYALDDVVPEKLEYPINIAFDLIKPQLDANKRRRENGKKGGAPKGNQNARKTREEKWYEPIMQEWNGLSQYGISKIVKISESSQRYGRLQELVNEYGNNGIYKAIDNIRNSTYLQGKGSTSWKIDFDWFIVKDNFVKVLEGKYQENFERKIMPIKNRFHNFDQRDNIDYKELEERLLAKNRR